MTPPRRGSVKGHYGRDFIQNIDTDMRLRDALERPEELCAFLEGLTNSQFRQAGKVLGDSLLVDMDRDRFWNLFRILLLSNRKAYLGTLLRALLTRMERCRPEAAAGGRTACDEAGLWGEEAMAICSMLNDTDRRKVLLALLPLSEGPDEAERMLRQCGIGEPGNWIPLLLQTPTNACRFLLLKALHHMEHDRMLLIRTCLFLMKRGNDADFNLAALIRHSFALEEVRGTFSLSLKPYELSRIEQNYEAFLRTVCQG